MNGKALLNSFSVRWTSVFAAAVSGVLIALSFPKAGLALLAWVGLIPLLVAMEDKTPRQAFTLGCIAGASAYSLALPWLNIVMTRYGHLPLAVSIPLYLLLVAWLALFYGFAALVTRTGENIGIKSAFSLPVAWVAGDLLRSFIFTGFPWSMIGHSQYRILPVIQIADIAGVYSITFIIVLANVVFYRILRGVGKAPVPYPAKSAAVLLILVSFTLFYGFNCLTAQSEPGAKALRVALIQGNIPQDVKWSPAFRDKTVDIYEQLSLKAASGGTDLIVWPESAVPFFFQDEEQHAERLRSIARRTGSSLFFGSPAHERREGRTKYLNSAFLIAPDGTTVGRSDKMHMVPFGEYVPLGRFFPFISKLVTGIGDFVPGLRFVTLPLMGTSIGTLVCYEAIFPEIAREYVRNGAKILINITNDAWFGDSSAPYQHLSMAAFRAVETRTPLLRAANTGITAIVDSNGHIRNMTPLFEESYRTGEIQPGAGSSIYLRTGDAFAWICLLISVFIAARGVPGIRPDKQTHT